MATRKLIVAILIIALTAAFVAGCGVGEASVASRPDAEAATPIPVEVAHPQRTDLFATYEATTTIESDADAPAVARVAGVVVELLVEEGDRVAGGQVLARLDGERLRLTMLSAKAELDRVQSEYDRYTDLAARGLVSAAMFEGLRYDLDALRASYELARLNFDYSHIRAPIDGIVATREIKPGEHVDVNDVAFRITDTRELLAELMIPQSELAKFSAGHNAKLAVDSMPGRRFDARIARISPTIDTRNGTFRATAVIDNAEGDLAPGMFARFTIAYEEHANALVIPARALVAEDEELAVYIVDNGEVTRRIVQTGIQTRDVVEILSGLDGDEQVVVVGHAGLRDGSKVLASNTQTDSYAG